jgi:hypothetical protein
MTPYPETRPRIHVIELAPFGFRYYRGAYESFDEVPPRYTWRKVDYRVYDTMVYVDMENSDPSVATSLTSW